MDIKNTLNLTLEYRFPMDDEDSLSEAQDIVNHGIAGGFHDFIYTHNINEFFNEFENEIEDYYYEIFGDSWLRESGASDKNSLDEVRVHLVWGLVEMWVSDKLDEIGG